METKKPRNFETKKPRTTKPFPSKGLPSTPQHTGFHPCTRLPMKLYHLPNHYHLLELYDLPHNCADFPIIVPSADIFDDVLWIIVFLPFLSFFQYELGNRKATEANKNAPSESFRLSSACLFPSPPPPTRPKPNDPSIKQTCKLIIVRKIGMAKSIVPKCWNVAKENDEILVKI